jgi:hypothetical protein
MSGSENISSDVSDSDRDATVNHATVVQWFQIGILSKLLQAVTSNWQRHFKVYRYKNKLFNIYSSNSTKFKE